MERAREGKGTEGEGKKGVEGKRGRGMKIRGSLRCWLLGGIDAPVLIHYRYVGLQSVSPEHLFSDGANSCLHCAPSDCHCALSDAILLVSVLYFCHGVCISCMNLYM